MRSIALWEGDNLWSKSPTRCLSVLSNLDLQWLALENKVRIVSPTVMVAIGVNGIIGYDEMKIILLSNERRLLKSPCVIGKE